MKRILLVLTVFSALILAFRVQAEISPAIRIRSVYKTNVGTDFGNETKWIFEKTDANQIEVKREGSVDSILSLFYDDNGRLERVLNHISKERSGRQLETLRTPNASFFLSDGFPVPYDDLNFQDLTVKETVYEKQAGGMTFAFTVQRKTDEITVDEAIQLKMISKEQCSKLQNSNLTLLSLFKGKQLLVKQLWCFGDAWWLYEETPYRRSWRMP